MTFLAGDLPTAEQFDAFADLNDWRTLAAVKPSDTTRNSTTVLAADPHLSITYGLNRTYAVTVRLVVNSGATPDFKFDFSAAAGVTMSDYTYQACVPPTGIEYGTLALISTVGAMNCDGSNRPLTITGTLVTGGTPGAFTLRWAQNTSDAGNTILRAGSSITFIRLA